MASQEADFTIDLTGDVTGERYPGTFTAVKFLSSNRKLIRDSKRRELLGPSPQGQAPDSDTESRARMHAEIAARLVKWPAWWSEKGFGLDIVDDNVLIEIFTKVIAIENAAIEAVKDSGKTAREGLKTLAAEQEKA